MSDIKDIKKIIKKVQRTKEQERLHYEQIDQLQIQIFQMTNFVKYHGNSYFNFILYNNDYPFLDQIQQQCGIFYNRIEYLEQRFYQLPKKIDKINKDYFESVQQVLQQSQISVKQKLDQFEIINKGEMLKEDERIPIGQELLFLFKDSKIQEALIFTSIQISPLYRQLQSQTTVFGSITFVPFQKVIQAVQNYQQFLQHMNLTLDGNQILPYQFYTIVDGILDLSKLKNLDTKTNQVLKKVQTQVTLQQPLKLQGDLQGFERQKSDYAPFKSYYKQIGCQETLYQIFYKNCKFPELFQAISNQDSNDFVQIVADSYKNFFFTNLPERIEDSKILIQVQRNFDKVTNQRNWIIVDYQILDEQLSQIMESQHYSNNSYQQDPTQSKPAAVNSYQQKIQRKKDSISNKLNVLIYQNLKNQQEQLIYESIKSTCVDQQPQFEQLTEQQKKCLIAWLVIPDGTDDKRHFKDIYENQFIRDKQFNPFFLKITELQLLKDLKYQFSQIIDYQGEIQQEGEDQ